MLCCSAWGCLSHWVISAAGVPFLSKVKIVISRIGTKGSICCKKARADLAFSAIYTVSPRAMCCTCSGSQKERSEQVQHIARGLTVYIPAQAAIKRGLTHLN